MSEDLREEIARALANTDDKWKGWPWVAISERIQKLFLKDADAILPIIARVRDEARKEGRSAGYFCGLQDGIHRSRNC